MDNKSHVIKISIKSAIKTPFYILSARTKALNSLQTFQLLLNEVSRATKTGSILRPFFAQYYILIQSWPTLIMKVYFMASINKDNCYQNLPLIRQMLLSNPIIVSALSLLTAIQWQLIKWFSDDLWTKLTQPDNDKHYWLEVSGLYS